MRRIPRQTVLKDLRRLPGVGPSIAEDLYALGMRSVEDLRSQDPEHLYERHCQQKGMTVDRCVLYVFRCAVYVSRTARPRPDLTLWWNWKDRKLARSGSSG
jgi:hypothetical protein